MNARRCSRPYCHGWLYRDPDGITRCMLCGGPAEPPPAPLGLYRSGASRNGEGHGDGWSGKRVGQERAARVRRADGRKELSR